MINTVSGVPNTHYGGLALVPRSSTIHGTPTQKQIPSLRLCVSAPLR